MGNILGLLVGAIISGGLYVLYDRRAAQRIAEYQRETAQWRPAGAPRQRPTVRLLVVMVVGGACLFFGVFQVRGYFERRHPAVDEHRAELLDVAAQRLGCEQAGVTVRPKEPTLAQVEGCGRSVTVRWGRVRARTRTTGAAHWHQIDPDCHVDYMGCALPCE